MASTWPFCPHCGTVLKAPMIDEVKCTYCSYKTSFKELAKGDVITRNQPRQPQQWVRLKTDKSSAATLSDKHAIIQEPCPKCNNPEQYFYTMQLRSVDEGSTVFYECPKCDHKYSINN